jgi:hypothetical protein
MNTKLIMSSTAIFFAILGISLTFAPDYVTLILGIDNSPVLRLVLQLLGATYYGFAMLNWMAKGAHIGGIYNRPIATTNLCHFIIAALALTKAVVSNNQLPLIFSVLAVFCSVAAVVFGYIISRHPSTATA